MLKNLAASLLFRCATAVLVAEGQQFVSSYGRAYVPWADYDYYQNRYETPGRRRQQHYPPPTSPDQGPYYERRQPVNAAEAAAAAAATAATAAATATASAIAANPGALVAALEALLPRRSPLVDNQLLALYNLMKCWHDQEDFRECDRLVEKCDALFGKGASTDRASAKRKNKKSKRKKAESDERSDENDDDYNDEDNGS